jgi:hypothetical protein
MHATREVAGITIPDSELARGAEDLVRETSPPYLFNHCARTFVFGALAARRAGIEHDGEASYLAAMLHDLGLVPPYADDRRFETSGADAARSFVLQRGFSEAWAEKVWDAVALHAQIGIAEARGAEVTVVHLGASVDVVGVGYENLPADLIQETVAAYPRLHFKQRFQKTLIEAAKRNPNAYVLSWMADTVREHGIASLPTFEQLLSASPKLDGTEAAR